jgi:uncharacterized membrane protein YraQ (UPF0718 family)
MITTIILYFIAFGILLLSLLKSKEKTKEGMKSGAGMALSTVPEILGIMALVSLLLAFLPPETIKTVLGGKSEFLSTLYGAGIGTITIIPAFIAFPLSKTLVDNGAYIVSVAAFLTTLTMVGFATYPIEAKHFGRKFALLRNAFSFVAAIVIALGMGVIL